MIGTFLGEQNSGKTLAMTYFANLYYKNGYKIFANYNLTNIKHTKLTGEILKEYTENKKQFNRAVFLIDEIYLFMDSRNFGKKLNKLFSYFVLQTSKRDVHLLGTAQYFNTIEKRFRDNSNFKTFCSRVYKVYDKQTNTISYMDVSDKLRFLKNNNNSNNNTNKELYIKLNFVIKNILDGLVPICNIKTYYLKAEPIFKLYDTKELLAIE